MPSFDPDAILEQIKAYIEGTVDVRKEDFIRDIAAQLTVAFSAGYVFAGKQLPDIYAAYAGPLGTEQLDPIIERLGPVLDETFGSLSKELTDIVDAGIKNGSSYEQVIEQLKTKINTDWGESISFHRRGQKREYIHVSPDGTMKRATKTISKNVTIQTDAYALTLARTNMHAAYSRGHRERYQAAGCPGWTYQAVADEVTRKHHLALHGRVFLFDTPDEEMACEVQEEPNCRCRKRPYFGDPKYDIAPEKLEKERVEMATAELQNELVQNNAIYDKVVTANPGSEAELKKLSRSLGTTINKDADAKFMGAVANIGPNQAGRMATGMLAENFYVQGGGEYSFVHIAKKHPEVKMSQVLETLNTGTVVSYKGQNHAILQLSQNKLLDVPLSMDESNYGAVKTAFIVSKSRAENLMAAPKSDYIRKNIWEFTQGGKP